MEVPVLMATVRHDAEQSGGGMAAEAPDPWVIPLGSVRNGASALVGGKAAPLAVLRRAGVPVPDGFCVTTAAFRHHLASLPDGPRLIELLSRMMGGDGSDRLPAVSRALREAIVGGAICGALAGAIRQAWRTLGGEGGWAVRSSATVEDAAGHSCAGQFDSFLHVSDEAALLRAVQHCWRSLYAERALAYFRERRIPTQGMAMAVLVQRMVPAERAGVVFTADPVTGDRQRCVVEYVPGLGDGLVHGRVAPCRLVLDKATGQTLAMSEPAGSPADLMCEDARRRLWSRACEAERLLGAPQDIEWAEHGGEIFLVQSRPLTLDGRLTTGPPAVWSNLNVAENLPRVATPMTWSLLDFCLHRVLAPLLRGLGVDPDRTPWVGLVAGRVYMNVGTLARLMQRLPGFRYASMARTFGGYQDGLEGPLRALARRPALGWRERWRGRGRLVGLAAWFLWRATWRGADFCRARLRAMVTDLTRVELGGLPEGALVPHLDRVWRELLLRGPVAVSLGTGMAYQVGLEWVCREWFGDRNGRLANRLLSRAGGMASAASALDLWRLAAWVADQPALRSAVASAASVAGLATSLSADPVMREFGRRWDAFLAAHGHHAGGELDVATPRWSEDPDAVLRQLQHYLASRAALDLEETLARRTREREGTLAECRGRLRNPVRRRCFGLLVRRAQGWLVARENLKSEFVRAVAHARRVLLELGDRLARDGRLGQPEDVFFLTLEELEPVRTGRVSWEVRSRIRERRAEHARWEALRPPPVVVGDFAADASAVAPWPRADGNTLSGLPVSPGVVTGRARVILDANLGERVAPGEILVAPATDPGWTPLFLTAAGLVVELGGQLSHGSVIAREYGLPAVVNVPFATQRIRNGQRLRVDADRGEVILLD